jgi:hypothetical protein
MVVLFDAAVGRIERTVNSPRFIFLLFYSCFELRASEFEEQRKPGSGRSWK